MLNLSILISGQGSNFTAIHSAIVRGELNAHIGLLVASRPDAGGIRYAETHRIPVASIAHVAAEATTDTLLGLFETHDIDTIALAGYVKRIPPEVVHHFHQRMFNIHPALLPSFGGQGMYGRRVHEAVLASGVKVSGATVHIVDEEYDRGPIVLQETVPVLFEDSVETLAARVLDVEHRIYPHALQLFSRGKLRIQGQRVQIL